MSCEASAPLLRTCQFALAVQSGNLAGLSASERQVAARTTDLPARKFRGRQCELVGDITARCVITFSLSPGAFETTSAAFDVQPANCTYNDGACSYPPGEQPRYEVVGYEGLE